MSEEIKIIPNPYVVENGNIKGVKIIWSKIGMGDVKVKIYNIKGELIREIRDRIERKEVIWDIRMNPPLVRTVIDEFCMQVARKLNVASTTIRRILIDIMTKGFTY